MKAIHHVVGDQLPGFNLHGRKSARTKFRDRIFQSGSIEESGCRNAGARERWRWGE